MVAKSKLMVLQVSGLEEGVEGSRRRDRVCVAVGDLPHAVLTPEHQRGAQRRDDRVVVAGDPAFVPLNLEDIAEL